MEEKQLPIPSPIDPQIWALLPPEKKLMMLNFLRGMQTGQQGTVASFAPFMPKPEEWKADGQSIIPVGLGMVPQSYKF